jgi:CubicO group peptidase (beta-lactamase class C family)
MDTRLCSTLLLMGALAAHAPDTPAGRHLIASLDASGAGRRAVVGAHAGFRPPQAAQAVKTPQASKAATSPAERQFRAWLDVFNRGNRDEYLMFLRGSFPSREADLDEDMNFTGVTGGFDVRRVEAATATTITCLVQERASDQFARAELEVEAAAPYRIVRVDLNAVPRPAEYPIPGLAEADLIAALGQRLDREAAKDMFSGAVLVGRNGKVIFSAAYGPADREKKIPNTLNTRFRLGSMNKMFTATATLQLVQADKLKLTAPLGQYLTDYPNKDVATKVTIHHLLTHTGGTGDIFGPEFSAHRLELRTLNDYVALYGTRGLRFEPGAKWEYSNYGFLLLGVIIERVSGQSYYDYVRDHVFGPAGMTSSGSEPEDQVVPDRSKGYMKETGIWTPNTATLPYRGTSAGGGYTTVGDLLRFATALTGHVLLDATHTALLTTGKVDAGDRGKYAYGFVDGVTGGARSIGHGGGAPGMNGDLRIFPQSGYVVAALANMDSGASRATDWVGARLPR